MKIVNIARDFKKPGIFLVTFKPNFFEKIIGIKEKTIGYRQTDERFKNGWTKYILENESSSFNIRKISKAIDNWIINH